MLVMLAYDVPQTRHQTLLRKAFEALGGHRVQYSLYLFEGEVHEIERIVRYMRRVAALVPTGDIRLIPMEKSVWEQQVILKGDTALHVPRPLPDYVLLW